MIGDGDALCLSCPWNNLGYVVDVFLAYLALWAGSEPLALPGKFERNRGGTAMNRVKSRVLLARIYPIQAFSL